MNSKLIEAWAAWMTGCIQFPGLDAPPTWAWFWTLTFLEEVSAESAKNALKRWLRMMASVQHGVGEHVRFVFSMERQKRGVLHFHVLHDLPASTVFDAIYFGLIWRRCHRNAGKPLGLPYDAQREAKVASYIAKEGEVDGNVACPRLDRACKRTRRGHSCQLAPGPW